MDKLINAYNGKSASQGGLNLGEIKELAQTHNIGTKNKSRVEILNELHDSLLTSKPKRDKVPVKMPPVNMVSPPLRQSMIMRDLKQDMDAMERKYVPNNRPVHDKKQNSKPGWGVLPAGTLLYHSSNNFNPVLSFSPRIDRDTGRTAFPWFFGIEAGIALWYLTEQHFDAPGFLNVYRTRIDLPFYYIPTDNLDDPYPGSNPGEVAICSSMACLHPQFVYNRDFIGIGLSMEFTIPQMEIPLMNATLELVRVYKVNMETIIKFNSNVNEYIKNNKYHNPDHMVPTDDITQAIEDVIHIEPQPCDIGAVEVCLEKQRKHYQQLSETFGPPGH